MPEETRPTQAVQAVGIDLGTTYSVVSHLNEAGEPLTIPNHVVENSKRFMGDVGKRWWINSRPYSPVDIATLILKKLVSAAQDKIGPISQAVIPVPAPFSR